MSRVTQLCEALRILTSKENAGNSGNVANILETKCRTILEKLAANGLKQKEFDCIKTETDLSIRLVKITLQVLSLLNDSLMADGAPEALSRSVPAAPSYLLSVEQQKTVGAALQFIVALGICPNLLPGVGVSLERRLEHSQFFEAFNDPVISSSKQKYERLVECVDILIKCSACHSLGSLIYSNHLTDLLAALLQLSYAPLKKPTESESAAEWNLLSQEQVNHKSRLNEVISKCLQTTVIRELLLLQGASSTAIRKGKRVLQRAPQWLRKACASLLSERLLYPNGVLSVIMAVLDFTGLQSVTDWKKCDVVAKLISSSPEQLPPQEYIALIAPQVLSLLKVKDQNQQNLLRVAAGVMKYTPPQIAKSCFFNHIFQPIILCGCMESRFCVTEEELSVCIENIHKVFVLGSDPDAQFLANLDLYFNHLLVLFSQIMSSTTYIKSLVEELLLRYLEHGQTDSVLEMVRVSLLMEDTAKTQVLPPSLNVNYTDSGGVVLTINDKHDDEYSCLTEDQLRTEAIIALFAKLKTSSLPAALFLSLLQDMSSRRPDITPQSACDNTLLQFEEQRLQVRRSLIITGILTAFTESPELQNKLMDDRSQTLSMVKTLLMKGARLCLEETSYDDDSQTLTMAMGILVLLISEQTPAKEKEITKDCFDSLTVLASRHASDRVRTVATELRIAIATHGIVNGAKLSSTNIPKVPDPSRPAATEPEHTKPKSAFEDAWSDLFDPEVFVVGNALLRMRKLLDSKDSEAMNSRDKLLSAFQEKLGDEDSYVYLMAIHGLVSLASCFPDQVVQSLTAEYANRSSENRMKLGEALVKIIPVLGELVPKYRDILLNTLLSSCRDPDPHIVASSLSNVGEACKALKFSLSGSLVEIIMTSTSMMRSESLEVRRAAVLVISMIIQGLGTHSLKILEGQLLEVYRLLKMVYQTDTDDVVVLHAQLAITELNEVVKDFMFPQQDFTKRIFVLDPPE